MFVKVISEISIFGNQSHKKYLANTDLWAPATLQGMFGSESHLLMNRFLEISSLGFLPPQRSCSKNITEKWPQKAF